MSPTKKRLIALLPASLPTRPLLSRRVVPWVILSPPCLGLPLHLIFGMLRSWLMVFSSSSYLNFKFKSLHYPRTLRPLDLSVTLTVVTLGGLSSPQITLHSRQASGSLSLTSFLLARTCYFEHPLDPPASRPVQQPATPHILRATQDHHLFYPRWRPPLSLR